MLKVIGYPEGNMMNTSGAQAGDRQLWFFNEPKLTTRAAFTGLINHRLPSSRKGSLARSTKGQHLSQDPLDRGDGGERVRSHRYEQSVVLDLADVGFKGREPLGRGGAGCIPQTAAGRVGVVPFGARGQFGSVTPGL